MANHIGVIGAGVMGEALIAALIRSGINPGDISFAEKRDDRAAELTARYLIVHRDLSEVAAQATTILLVVKPQDMAATLSELAPQLNADALLISFAAGKTIASITNGLGKSNPVIRVMPNTPSLLGKGASGYSLGVGVTAPQRDFVATFLAATGKAIEVPESLQDAVTATSGSGPAYFFAFVEAMVEGSVALGLSREDATLLTIQTIVGAAALLESSGDSPTTLREKVTSPNGTTAAAIASFSASGLNEIVAQAMAAAAKRSQELA
ncbi:MAG: pyrroline-5-carboxylate reductase [Candidatus Planktophila sp.]|nr:pyrroline-5-carboxylate reductase [Candidatus Planktophila sp.]